jgi:hypothetical protein
LLNMLTDTYDIPAQQPFPGDLAANG